MLETTLEFVRPAKARPDAERWTVAEIAALFELPFNDLMFRAQTAHREHFDPNAIQVSTLLSRIAATVRSLPATTRALKTKNCWRWMTWLQPPGRPRKTAPPASAWVPPGAARSSAIWSRC